MAITRLSLDGYGAKRAGSFAGKAAATSHPVGRITRLSLDGYGVKRAGSFAGKTGGVIPPTPAAPETFSGGWEGGGGKRQRARDYDEQIRLDRIRHGILPPDAPQQPTADARRLDDIDLHAPPASAPEAPEPFATAQELAEIRTLILATAEGRAYVALRRRRALAVLLMLDEL